MIINGALPPGSKLTEATLAEQLGVSRGPVREAFRMLEEAGLVQNEKNRGVFVRSLSPPEVLEIFEVRSVLEQYAARRAAELANPAQVRELRRLLREMEQAGKQADAASYHRLNLVFHESLLTLAGNAKLTATYQRLVKELSLYRRQNLTPESMRQYSLEHKEIVRAIAAGDGPAATLAMQSHVFGSRDRTMAKQTQAAATV